MEFNIFPTEAGIYLFSGIQRFNGNNPDTLPSDVIGIITNSNMNVFTFIDGSYRFIDKGNAGISWFGTFYKLELPSYAHSYPNTNRDPEAYHGFVNLLRDEIKKQ